MKLWIVTFLWHGAERDENVRASNKEQARRQIRERFPNCHIIHVEQA